jgi:DNA modification methylase
MATLHHGDCLEVLRGMANDSVDSVVTDPPYGLSFMGKKWDYDVPSEDIWRECLRVLKPGGHLLAFAGTRTQHRMAVRIEDAGFEIRDMIAWVYGSGFPKSLDVSKAIDKAAGAALAQCRCGVGFMNAERSGGITSRNTVGAQRGRAPRPPANGKAGAPP